MVIWLGLFSQFIKSLYPYRKRIVKNVVIIDRPGKEEAVEFLNKLFCSKTKSKIIQGQFDRSEIRKLMKRRNEFGALLSNKRE